MPASQMRRDAYASNCHIPGPIKDPTGWFALPEATSFGMFPDDLGQRQVAIDCTVRSFAAWSLKITKVFVHFTQLYLAEPVSI